MQNDESSLIKIREVISKLKNNKFPDCAKITRQLVKYKREEICRVYMIGKKNQINGSLGK